MGAGGGFVGSIGDGGNEARETRGLDLEEQRERGRSTVNLPAFLAGMQDLKHSKTIGIWP